MNSSTLVPISLNRSGETISNEVERWLSSLFRGTGLFFDSHSEKTSGDEGSKTGTSHLTFAPRVDLAETDEMVHVIAELPGVAEKDIDVTFSEGVLVLKGEKKPALECENMHYLHKESFCGKFYRRIILSKEVEEEKINASYANGVLSIKLPKTQKTRESVRKIPVQV